MTDKQFESKYSEYLNYFDTVLNKFCDGVDCKPKLLAESLVYSLKLGGKRVRPVLMFAVGDALGVERGKLENFALALELIHTYSLIHDDLPEMDNDDFRRGKPSNHKVFGVGNAVLAGDGLLNTAYSLLFDECRKGAEYISAAQFICNCAGIYGMIAGQSADLNHEHESGIDEKLLNFIYEQKTSKLIQAAVMAPVILGGGKFYGEFKTFGSELGYLFQLTDDILDVEGEFSKLGKSIGKDSDSEKYTAIRVFGLERSKFRADIITSRCKGILEGVDCDGEFLSAFVSFVRSRNK